MSDVDVLLKPREAAAALGVSYPTLKQWILAGTLKTIKTPGGHHRIPQSALNPLMKSKPTTARKTSRERFRNVSGRNQLVGTITQVKISGLLAQVSLKIGDQQITSIITSDAAREMQLRKGQTAGALIKSTEVTTVSRPFESRYSTNLPVIVATFAPSSVTRNAGTSASSRHATYATQCISTGVPTRSPCWINVTYIGAL
jgi:molybdopterin-binding protein